MTEGRRPRLGDVIDDYCPRCRLITNHGVVGLLGPEVKRVRCNTCLNEHDYRRAEMPKRKKNAVKELFDQVLAKIPHQAPTPPPPAGPPRRRSPHVGLRNRPRATVGRPAGKPGGGRRKG